jgi:anti-anti-sigma factor
MRGARIAVDLRTYSRASSSVPTVEVGGEIDIESRPDLHDRLLSIMRVHGPRLALDLTGVAFIDCAGVSALLARYAPSVWS